MRSEFDEPQNRRAGPALRLGLEVATERDEDQDHRRVHEVHRVLAEVPIDATGDERGAGAKRDQHVHVGREATELTQGRDEERLAEIGGQRDGGRQFAPTTDPFVPEVAIVPDDELQQQEEPNRESPLQQRCVARLPRGEFLRRSRSFARHRLVPGGDNRLGQSRGSDERRVEVDRRFAPLQTDARRRDAVDFLQRLLDPPDAAGTVHSPHL